MTLSDAGDREGGSTGGCTFPSDNKDLTADVGWLARVQDTAVRFNESVEVTDEAREAASARLDAVMGRYHQFMGVSGLEESDADPGNCGIVGGLA